MITIATSTWSPDTEQSISIEGIPLNANAGITQIAVKWRPSQAAVLEEAINA